jgi:type II secretory pathway pseudopilin PulG
MDPLGLLFENGGLSAGGVLTAVVAALITYVFNAHIDRQAQRRAARLQFVQDQLRLLYGPLYAITRANETISRCAPDPAAFSPGITLATRPGRQPRFSQATCVCVRPSSSTPTFSKPQRFRTTSSLSSPMSKTGRQSCRARRGRYRKPAKSHLIRKTSPAGSKKPTLTLRAGTPSSSARSAGGDCRSCRTIEKPRLGHRFESGFPIVKQDAKVFLLKFLQISLQIKI